MTITFVPLPVFQHQTQKWWTLMNYLMRKWLGKILHHLLSLVCCSWLRLVLTLHNWPFWLNAVDCIICSLNCFSVYRSWLLVFNVALLGIHTSVLHFWLVGRNSNFTLSFFNESVSLLGHFSKLFDFLFSTHPFREQDHCKSKQRSTYWVNFYPDGSWSFP